MGPGTEFLGDAGAADTPERVTYRTVPKFDNERFGLVHDGTYWVQDIEVADGVDDGLADGYGEPVAEEFQTAAAEPAPNTCEGVRWVSALSERAAENTVELSLEGVSSVTLYVDETGVDTTTPLTLRVDSTDAAEITLRSDAGERVVEVPAGEGETTVTLCGRGSGRNRDRK